MPKKTNFKELTDEEIIRVNRMHITQPAAGEYGQVQVDTQLSIERGVIWLIHFVEFICDYTAIDDPAQDAEETEAFQLTRDTKGAMVNALDADLVCQRVWMIKRAATIGTDTGPMWAYGGAPYVRNFLRPLPYAAQNIFFGYHSTHSVAKVAYCRIGYSIRQVSDSFFFRVAQAIIG